MCLVSVTVRLHRVIEAPVLIVVDLCDIWFPNTLLMCDAARIGILIIRFISDGLVRIVRCTLVCFRVEKKFRTLPLFRFLIMTLPLLRHWVSEPRRTPLHEAARIPVTRLGLWPFRGLMTDVLTATGTPVQARMNVSDLLCRTANSRNISVSTVILTVRMLHRWNCPLVVPWCWACVLVTSSDSVRGVEGVLGFIGCGRPEGILATCIAFDTRV